VAPVDDYAHGFEALFLAYVICWISVQVDYRFADGVMYAMENSWLEAVDHSRDVGEIRTPADAISVCWLHLGIEMYVVLVGQSP
jgi:hypothetical protein